RSARSKPWRSRASRRVRPISNTERGEDRIVPSVRGGRPLPARRFAAPRAAAILASARRFGGRFSYDGSSAAPSPAPPPWGGHPPPRRSFTLDQVMLAAQGGRR